MMGIRQGIRGRAAQVPVWILIVFVFSSAAFSSAAPSVSKEYELKAGLLLRLAQFVQWPKEAFPRTNSPIVIGVLGANPFGDSLNAAVRNETARERSIVVRNVSRIDNIPGCHILFISASERDHVPAILRSLDSRSILTVSDIEGFSSDHKGMVTLLGIENGKVPFRVNMDSVKAANLTVDARLLGMADSHSKEK